MCFRLCFWLLLFIFVAEKANKSDTNVKKLPMNLKRLLPLLIVPLLLTACPAGARLFGDTLDPQSEISRKIASSKTQTLLASHGTKPNFYVVVQK